ncbi:MAG: zinc-dependent alcohol dehydrogenase family protein [Granulosicoccus sp.]
MPDIKEPSDWEVCVDIMVTTVNPSDVSVLRGQYGSLPSSFPATPGLEGVGRVVSAGKSVKDFSAGDRVILISNNNWVQRKNVPATSLIRIPDGLSLEQAALVKVNAGCALHMLNTFAHPQTGNHVIMNAPMSSVGQMLITFAREKGLKTVCVVRREDAVKETLEYGADYAVVAGENLGQSVSEATGGASIKVAFDAVAGESTAQLADCLDVGGTLVNYGMLSGQSCHVRPDHTIFRDLHVCGFWLLKELKSLKLRERRGLLEETMLLMEQRGVTNDVHARFPIEQISDAVEASESPERTGKVLILPNGPVE